MTRLLILALVLACDFLSFGIVALFIRSRGLVNSPEAPKEEVRRQDLPAVAYQPAFQADLPSDIPPFTSETIAQIHEKYKELAETDPILAGRLKYQDLLAHHGE